MKKTMVVIFFLIVLFTFPFNSFGKSFTYPLIYARQGDIEGLVFYFDPPLYVELPGYDPFYVAFVKIETSGREVAIITQQKKYIYFGDYGSGIIRAWDNTRASGTPVEIPMQSAKLTEQFTLEGSLPEDPFSVSPTEDVDLLFSAKLGIPPNTFNFVLLILNGEIVLVGAH
ncbi:MAG: hypothetical protein ACUVWN_09930 [bacterium]